MLKLLTFIADAIQQSRRRIDDFKCLGKQLEKYRTSAQRCNIMLSDWSDFWNIRSTDESAAGIKRWGIEGWAVVEHTLAIIDELSIDILLLLREFHDDDKIKEQLNSIAESRARKAQKATENGPNKLRKKMPLSIKAKNEALMALPETRRDAIQAQKDRAKANQEALALNKKLNLVFGDSEKIGKLCSELEESIVSLDRFSEKRFLVRFPHLEKSFSLYTANREADSRYRTRLLNHSEGLRKVALGLYNSCLVVEAQDLRIPIENVAIGDLEDSIRTYHVICEPKTDQARELKLQIMKEEPIDNVYQNINDACRNAIKKVAHLVCSAELNEKDYFALEVVQERFEVAQQSLAKLLQDTRNKIENKEKLRLFPTQEREILAYQLAESAFLFLGTTWLSQLNSANLYQLHDVERKIYLLKLREPRNPQCQLLQELQNHRDYLDVQCWSLGILLLEIKLGMKVESFRGQGDQVFFSLADETEIDIDGPELDIRCGPTYGRAIRFCFNPKTTLSGQGVRDIECRKVLKKFYRIVLVPLEEEYKRGVARESKKRAAL